MSSDFTDIIYTVRPNTRTPSTHNGSVKQFQNVGRLFFLNSSLNTLASNCSAGKAVAALSTLSDTCPKNKHTHRAKGTFDHFPRTFFLLRDAQTTASRASLPCLCRQFSAIFIFSMSFCILVKIRRDVVQYKLATSH